MSNRKKRKPSIIGINAKRLIERKDLTQEQVAKSVKCNQQAIAHLETGVTKKPRFVKKLAEVLGTTYEELTTLEAEYSRKMPQLMRHISDCDSLDDLQVGEFIMIDKLSETAVKTAKKVSYAVEKKPGMYSSSWIQSSCAESTDILITTVIDRSMSTTLHLGDEVAIDLSQNEIQNGKVYAFIREDGRKEIRRLYLIGNKVRASSDNTTEPEYRHSEEFLEKDIEVIGRIIAYQGSGGL